jgi:uncharacterized membrane protein
VQWPALQTAISFLDTTKYPPSLLFLLMTLGPALILLAAFDGGTPRLLRPVSVYGKVPLFYFLVHVPLIHLLAAGACYVRYGQAYGMFETPSVNVRARLAPRRSPVWPRRTLRSRLREHLPSSSSNGATPRRIAAARSR